MILDASQETDHGAVEIADVPSNNAEPGNPPATASIANDVEDHASLGGWTKRTVDLVIASMAILLASPLMLLAGGLIYAAMGRPILYGHTRIGQNGRRFRCLKFRSMVVDAHERLQAYLAAHPEARREWEETQKLRDDPRITPLGRVLRISSVDELPQLFNIFKGEMSCVGPRPVTAEELLARYGKHSRYYKKTRPGLTGLWQVSGRSGLTYKDRVKLDTAYVRKWSLFLDMLILLKTIPAVFRVRETS